MSAVPSSDLPSPEATAPVSSFKHSLRTFFREMVESWIEMHRRMIDAGFHPL